MKNKFSSSDNKNLIKDKLPTTSKNTLEKYENYTIINYYSDIKEIGLRKTWENINYFVLNFTSSNKFLNVLNLPELYEKGLAFLNKNSKKKNGQYFTPYDVASLMAKWFKNLKGDNICDVGCGTGVLILSYLDLIGKDEAYKIIKNGQLYIYDNDDIALNICKTILLIKYGKELEDKINYFCCDFLNKNITLPENCKVISNPPYSHVDKISSNWKQTEIVKFTKELYSMFMEKILNQSVGSVIITPYSFISGNNFYPLRNLMNEYEGFIVSFDNVPGNIFNGKKHGVFNTNTSNSVRAAITVVENNANVKGFSLTPLIRFKNEERKNLLTTDVIDNFIYNKKQIITEKNTKYYKCDKRLAQIWERWQAAGNKHLSDYINKSGKNILSVPNTCRYYTTAFKGILKRKGQITINIENTDVFNYVYCFINSSFAYWFWRLYDGGITFSKQLLLEMPVFFDKLSNEDKNFFNNTAIEMIDNSYKYIIKKNNVGIQENIKYPRSYKDKINRKLLDILDIHCDEKIFDIIHSNMALEINI